MKRLFVALSCASTLLFALTARAEPPPAQQPRAAPAQTTPPSKNPEDPHTSTTGGADKKTYQAGKKPDDSAGCSTPTTAQDAGVDTSKDSAVHNRSNGQRTVCTTAGAEGVHAKDKPKQKPGKKQSTPAQNTSPQPR